MEKQEVFSKVPEVTLLFWIIKILATTLGETGGDAVSMSMNLGYLVGTAIFAVLFVIAVVAQVSVKRFHPFLYWTTIIATTTVEWPREKKKPTQTGFWFCCISFRVTLSMAAMWSASTA